MSCSSAPLFVRSDILQALQSKEEDTRNEEEESQFACKSHAVNFLVVVPLNSSPRCDHGSNHSPRSLSCSSRQAPRTPGPSSHASRSCAPSVSRASVAAHTLEQRSRTFPRYRPYPPRDGPTPLELRFAARTTGPSSHLTMTMADVKEGKELLQATLGHFPQELLWKAYEAKRADRDSVVHRVAQTATEIEALERHREFSSAVKRHQENQLAVEESLLTIVKNTLSPRSLRDVEDDSGYYRAVFADELVALTVAETQLGQVGSVGQSIKNREMPE